jgi:hypothetical protein
VISSQPPQPCAIADISAGATSRRGPVEAWPGRAICCGHVKLARTGEATGLCRRIPLTQRGYGFAMDCHWQENRQRATEMPISRILGRHRPPGHTEETTIRHAIRRQHHRNVSPDKPAGPIRSLMLRAMRLALTTATLCVPAVGALAPRASAAAAVRAASAGAVNSVDQMQYVLHELHGGGRHALCSVCGSR